MGNQQRGQEPEGNGAKASSQGGFGDVTRRQWGISNEARSQREMVPRPVAKVGLVMWLGESGESATWPVAREKRFRGQ